MERYPWNLETLGWLGLLVLIPYTLVSSIDIYRKLRGKA